MFPPVKKPIISPKIQKLTNAVKRKPTYSDIEFIKANSEKCNAVTSHPDSFTPKENCKTGKKNDSMYNNTPALNRYVGFKNFILSTNVRIFRWISAWPH